MINYLNSQCNITFHEINRKTYGKGHFPSNKYIFRIMKIDELTKWILSVDRRVLVMKEIHENELIKTSHIAQKTGRSLQNISHALRELEEHGVIECLTPEKHTWKRYILTEKGIQIFEKYKKKHLFN